MLDDWTICVISVLDEKDCMTFSKDIRAIAELYELAMFSAIHITERTTRPKKPSLWIGHPGNTEN